MNEWWRADTALAAVTTVIADDVPKTPAAEAVGAGVSAGAKTLAAADEQLAQAARQGDAEALDQLMRRFKNVVRAKASAYFLTGGDRDDLIQEGMIGLFKAVRDYDPQKNDRFSAFVDLCVNRQILSAIKASARMKHTPLNRSLSLYAPVETGRRRTYLDVLDAAGGVSGEGNPERLLIDRETFNDIDSSLRKRLSNLEYEVFVLHLQGCCRSDIALKISRSVKSVDNTLLRIRRKAGSIVSMPTPNA